MKRATAFVLSMFLVVSTLSVHAAGFDAFQKINTYTQGQFSDVAKDGWYTPYIAVAYEHGLIRGDDMGLFLPEDNIQLAAVVTMAARLHAIYRGGSDSQFDQSVGTYWYDTYVRYADEHKLLTGLGRLNYGSEAKRWQVARLITNALPSEAFVTINIVDNGAIPDVTMEQTYSASVYTLYRAGILTGTPPINAFEPESAVTRGEVATFFSRTISPTLRRSIELRGTKDAYIQDVLRLVNQARAEQGIDPLKLDADILLAASVRASELQTLASHVRPDGTDCFSALTESGVTYRTAAENLAYGQRTPDEVVASWLGSESHRANILNPTFTRLGVGYYLSSNGTAYWIQLFCN